jgi:nitronate monooxygenase
MPAIETSFTKDTGIDIPLICGAMYPCSNPELVAAASNAGGIGIVQPISLTFVYKYDFRKGLQYIKQLTDRPIGFNALVENSSTIYLDRMRQWVDIALEEGVRFFVTALGNPSWVVDKVHACNGKVYHDVTGLQWARKAVDCGVDGLICVNANAGGHAGDLSPDQLFKELSGLDLPLICAGGIGDENDFSAALDMGYAGVQMGTRFIATTECKAHEDYKQAIINALAKDITLTDKISGVPVSIISTPYVKATGTRAGWLARKITQAPQIKTLYANVLYPQIHLAVKKSLAKRSELQRFFSGRQKCRGNSHH